MNQALKYAVAAALLAGGVALVAVAQTPPQTPAVTPPPAAPPVSPERFEPTDKVRADFDVSFPIDI
jgi:hypothetical protein